MTPLASTPNVASLGFTDAWFAAGVMSPESAADFVRIAGSGPTRPPRFWRWAAFRDFAEERGQLTPVECREVYRLGVGEPDLNLGTAIMCCSLYQPTCPADLIRKATGSDRVAVRRVAIMRTGGRTR